MSLASRINPIRYLKTHAAEIVRTLRDRPEPLVITQNGEARAVLQDTDSSEEIQASLALLRMLALGKRRIDTGEMQSAAEVIARLRKRLQPDRRPCWSS